MAHSDVFVIATVNNWRKIPRSLLRPGRIGKRIQVRMPKHTEVEAIVKHYLARTEKCKGLDEISVARMLSNESCATLENVIGCAAMKAAYNRQESVTMENIVIGMGEDMEIEKTKRNEYSYTDKAYRKLYHLCDSRIYDKYDAKENCAKAYKQMEVELAVIKEQQSAPLYVVAFEALNGVGAKPKQFCLRGAIASSIVCYILDFSEIDPLDSEPKLYPEFCFGINGEKKHSIFHTKRMFMNI